MGFDLREGDGQGSAEPVRHRFRVQERSADVHERRCADGCRVQPVDRPDQHEGPQAGRNGCRHRAHGAGDGCADAGVNPVTGQFEAVPNPNGGVETKTRAEQRAKAAQERKKKQIIIASVIGSIVVLLAVIGIFFALNGHKNTADLVSVPDFTDTSNISQARVEEQLKALGLKLDARDDSTSSQPKGTITKQNPKGGKKVAKGSTVSVWFSTGPQAVSVPDVSGKTQEEAKGILEAAGFKIGNVMTVDSAPSRKTRW